MPDRRNALLSAIRGEHRPYIFPWLEEVPLSRGDRLFEAGQTIDYAYFLDSGQLSIIGAPSKSQIEIAMIGREGMAGFPILLHCDQSPDLVEVTFSGKARRVKSNRLSQALIECPDIRSVLAPYGQVLSVQISDTLRSSALLRVEERLARWILMTHDRTGSGDILITHQDLANALSVRRPGVTTSLHILEGLNLIRARRGMVRVLDRSGLARLTRGTYGNAEAEHARLYSATSAAEEPRAVVREMAAA